MGKASRSKRFRGTGDAQHPEDPGAARQRGGRAPEGFRGGGEAPPPPGSGPGRLWEVPRSLAVILVAAAAARAVYFHLYSRTSIFFDGLILDSEVYDAWAKRIASGEWMGHEAFYHPPLYPYALGLLYRLAGPAHGFVYACQALLGLVGLVLIQRIGAAVFTERAGVVAAAGAALYGPFAFFETKILGTTLGLTLNLAALLFLVRTERAAPRNGPGPAWRWLVAGALIGAAAVCLPASVIFALFYAGTRALRDPRGAALLAAGTCAALLPVLAHNLYVAGDPLILSGQGGITFFQGNNATAQGLYNVLPGFSGSPQLQPSEEKSIAEREAGRALKRSEISSHFFGKGIDFIFGSPGAFLELEVKKLGRLLGNYEASTEYSLYLERDEIPWLWVFVLPYAAIVGLGVAALLGREGGWAIADLFPGRAALSRQGTGATALLLYTLHAAAVPLIFYVSSRYRLPLVPALLIYGGSLLDRLKSGVEARGQVSASEARSLGIAFVLGLLSFFPLAEPNVTAEANVHYNIGNLLAEKGKHEEAVRQFDRCLADFPKNDFAWINRGNSLSALDRLDEALDSYRRAEEARPGFWKAYQKEGSALHRLGRLEEEAQVYRRGAAAGGAEAHFLLAVTLQALQRPAEAISEIQNAIQSKPKEPRYQSTLGDILEGLRRYEDAGAAFRAALEADPHYSKARFSLGRVYREQGRIKDAIVVLEEALKYEPRNAQGHARLGEMYALSGENAKARAEYQTALAIEPGEPLARAGLDRLGR
jgi:tetratricopeptide (TPR) repeat protein/4-amino-4-deoxy-L-arabinose transferase-like glycosyltransferase